MRLDHETIKTLLPHRPPILLPQSVEIGNQGEFGVGHVLLDLDSRLWGDWLGRDLFRELVLEGAAQVLGLVLASARLEEATPSPGGRRLLLGFNNIEFTSGVAPVHSLEIKATVVQRIGGICRGRFVARACGGEIARGELTVMHE